MKKIRTILTGILLILTLSLPAEITMHRQMRQEQLHSLSSDCRLQLAYMKSELLVIVGQHTTVNTFPGLVHTARQTMRVGNTRSR